MKGYHNKANDSLAMVVTEDFTSYSLCNIPIVSLSSDGVGPKHTDVTTNDTSDHSASLYGYLHILHLWQHRNDTLIDVRMTYTYVLETKEK